MRRRTKEVRELESALLAQSKLVNQVFLLPELPDTTKDPAIAVISGKEVTVSSFADPEPVTTEFKGSPLAAIDKVLETLNKDSNYIVFFFKPSAANFFENVRDHVRESGFEIGYDLVDEETDLSLLPPKKSERS